MSERRNTNERYRHFTQEMFTAGDYEQFVSYIHEHRHPMAPPSSSEACTSLDDARFSHNRWTWTKYDTNEDMFQTFEYIFHKFKKGIYVQIVDNQLKVFLPFSNVDYRNEYAKSLQIDRSKYSSFEDIYKRICEYEHREYIPNRVCRYVDQWYCNNGLVRYEFPLKENDSGINMIHDMLVTLCKHRTVPDCEFFVNKRDFPILSLYGHEPYDALIPARTPLFSHACSSYLPILGMTTKEDFADIPIPTWEDWCRCSYQHDERLFAKHFKVYDKMPDIPWIEKYPTVIFRGTSTGLGTNVSDNPRLFFSKLSMTQKIKRDGKTLYLDVGITKWNTRPRKIRPTDALHIPEPDKLGIELVPPLSPIEQSRYKYILHLPGHSFAYRLGMELSMGSVIFLYPCDYSIWYLPLLQPYVHYIPLEKGMDANEIFQKVDWCDEHPQECEEIARNARNFYSEYLSFDATMTYMQNVLCKLAKKIDYTRPFCSMESHFRDVRNDLLESKSLIRNIGADVISVGSGLRLIKETKHTKIYTDDEFLYKVKEEDMSHSLFVSDILRDGLSHLTPNFSLPVAISSCRKILLSSSKDIPDFVMTLDAYLQSNTFEFYQLKLILNQIAASLDIAQKKLGFVHYDLCPWNVLLYRNKSNHLTYYFHDASVTIRNSKFIAKIIDFEYASVIHNTEIIHNMQPFFLSESHDMTTVLYNSFHIILKHQKLSKDDLQWVKMMMRFLANRDFWSVQDMKYFLSVERKFSRLILSSEVASKKMPTGSIMTQLQKLLKVPSVSVKICTNDWAGGSPTISIKSILDTQESIVLSDVAEFADYQLPNVVERLYTLHKMYEHLDKCIDICDVPSDIVHKIVSSTKMAMQKVFLPDVKTFLDCRNGDDSNHLCTKIYPINSHEWKKIRWLNFCSKGSLEVKGLSLVAQSVDTCHKMLYLLDRGYFMNQGDDDHESGSVYKECTQFLKRVYTNRLWKLSQMMLVK